MLELQNISWAAPGGGQVLRDVELTVGPGELLALTGPNGSGKTTLAKIIAGLEAPESGRIVLEGEDITGLDVTQRARKGIRFAFQQPVRFKGFTVQRLLELAAGGPLPEQEACGLLSQVGLCGQEYADRQLDGSLSGGEMKRVEIATVLARGGRLSIFDEPEAGIDLWSFESLIGVFARLRDRRAQGLLIISHQERILRIADRLAVISGGRVVRQGPPQEVLPEWTRNTPRCESCGKREAVFP